MAAIGAVEAAMGGLGMIGGGGMAVAGAPTIVGVASGAGIATAGAAVGVVGARSMAGAVEGLRNALARGEEGGGDDGPKLKSPKSGLSDKEAARDVPSWAKGNRPMVGESGKDFARRLLDEKYGPGNYDTGPGSEFSQIKKWGDRAFE